MINGTIKYRIDIPYYLSLSTQSFYWKRTVYKDVKEFIPNDSPTPKGQEVILTHYLDANLMHYMMTGK